MNLSKDEGYSIVCTRDDLAEVEPYWEKSQEITVDDAVGIVCLTLGAIVAIIGMVFIWVQFPVTIVLLLTAAIFILVGITYLRWPGKRFIK